MSRAAEDLREIIGSTARTCEIVSCNYREDKNLSRRNNALRRIAGNGAPAERKIRQGRNCPGGLPLGRIRVSRIDPQCGYDHNKAGMRL
jgi:hypothetical protein